MSETAIVGSALAREVNGSGPPLVLIHGLSSSRRAWDLIAHELAEDFTTYAIDLPGHGGSPSLTTTTPTTPQELARALEDFLDSEGIDTAHLVGNSMGGWIALEVAANGRAMSVTALCPAGFWRPKERPTKGLSRTHRAAIVTKPVIPAIMRIRPLRTALFRTGMERAGTVPYAVARDAALAQASAEGFDSCLAGMTGHNFSRAADIPADVPVTIAFGDNDHLLPAPRFQVRDYAPDHARWEVLWRCGHAPMWDVPPLTTRLIRETAACARSL
jgi:pimeloyl-ACP methyl ester carboxylesterase